MITRHTVLFTDCHSMLCYLERCHVYLTELIEELRVGREAGHARLDDEFSQTLAAAGVPHDEERDVQFDTNHLQ